MNEEMLDWHLPLKNKKFSQASYAKELKKFIEDERDTASFVVGWLAQGKTEEALQKVHAVKLLATDLGAKALSSASFSLEMALKAGADTSVCLNHFESVFVDTLLAMSVYLSK